MLTDNAKAQLRAGLFERTEEGIYLPVSRAMITGVFRYNIRGEEEEYSENMIVASGLDYMLASCIGAASVISSWYIAPFSGNVTVLSTWTAANFAANATEFTNYDSATRPAWSRGSVATGGADNFASKAEIESTQDGQVIRGAALISASGKGNTSGTLMGASRFPSDKNLDTGEILDIGYGLQLTAL